MKELNVRTCRDCGKTFRTPNPDQLCPTCKKKHRKLALERQTASYRKPPIKKTPPKPKVPLHEALRIVEIYNAIHTDKIRNYGEISKIIEDTKTDRCVCCGAVVPEGRMVCPICEKEGAE